MCFLNGGATVLDGVAYNGGTNYDWVFDGIGITLATGAIPAGMQIQDTTGKWQSPTAAADEGGSDINLTYPTSVIYPNPTAYRLVSAAGLIPAQAIPTPQVGLTQPA